MKRTDALFERWLPLLYTHAAIRVRKNDIIYESDYYWFFGYNGGIRELTWAEPHSIPYLHYVSSISVLKDRL